MHKINKISKLLLIMIVSALLFFSISTISASADEYTLIININIDNDIIYDGTEINYDIEFTNESLQVLTIDSADYDVEFFEVSDMVTPLGYIPINAGIYVLRVTYDGLDYDYTVQESTFSIGKRSIALLSQSTVTYGQEPNWQVTVMSGSYAPGENYNDINLDWNHMDGYVDFGIHNSGNISLDDENYSGIIRWILDIQAKDINMTITPLDITFGDSFNFETLMATGYEYEYGDTIDDLGIVYYIDGTEFDQIDLSQYGAETYSVTAIDNANNYNINITSSNLVINPKVARIDVSGTAIYGQDVYEQSIYNANLTNNLAYDDLYQDIEVTYYIDINTPNVGSNHTIMASNDNPNYIVLLSPANLNVTPRAISAEIDDKVFAYGTAPSFTLTLISGSYALGDSSNSLLPHYSGYQTNVSETPYTVTAVALSPNYNVTLISGELIIEPLSITIDVSDINISYGTSKTFNYTLPALPYSDTRSDLNIEVIADEINVGQHQSIVDYDNSNYDITFRGGRYTIAKKTIDVKIQDISSIIYGEIPSYASYLWKGSTLAYPNESMDDLNINYVPQSLNYGERYTISATYNNPNYDVIFDNGQINVAKRNINVIIDDVTVVYGANPIFTYRLQEGSTLAASDTLSALGISCSSGGINVIDAPLTITRTYDNDNYNITFIDGLHRIETREITIKVKNIIRQYGQTGDFDFSDVELVEGTMAFGEPLSSLNLNFSTVGTVVGEYTITVTTDNSNYTVTTQPGRLTVTKRRVDIVVDEIVKAFGDKDPEITFASSVDGIVFSGSLTRQSGESSGEYEVELGTLSAGNNYELNLIPATFIVDATLPTVAYAGLGSLGLAVLSVIFMVIRRFMGARIV